MTNNRDLLKEAIADAKAVKETAIANAKAALEEAFTPYLKEKLAAKLSEMDDMDEAKEMDEVKEKEMKENFDMDENADMDVDDVKETADADADDMNEMDLDELLKELDAMEEGKKEEMMEGEEDLLNNPQGPTSHGNVSEEEEMKMGEDEEEIDLENMSEDDLKSFIEGVIADMVATGELEGNIEAKDEKSDEDEIEVKDETEVKEVKSGNPYDTEDAIEYGKYLDSLEETSLEYTKMSGQDYVNFCKENPNDPGCLSESKKKMKKEMDEMKKELEEAYSALETVKSDLNEVNLLNAKLLYTNKIFRAKNLTESQKVKVLEAFDKATTTKEAKLVFETLSQGVANDKKTSVNESMIGGASKIAGIAPSKPILEMDNQFARWQTLAGIKK